MNDQLFPGGAITPPSIEQARLELARRSQATHQHRVKVFGTSIARAAPWDILLVLYVNYERTHINVSSIFTYINAPHTTGLRWLISLEKKGFVVRHSHPTDRRVNFVTLSPAGKRTLDQYFDALLSVNNAAPTRLRSAK